MLPKAILLGHMQVEQINLLYVAPCPCFCNFNYALLLFYLGTGGIQRPPLSCFAGHYCPPGTMYPTQYKCPVGTWSGRSGLEAESECRPCPRGWYCLAGAGTPSGRCSSGHYCPEGTLGRDWDHRC